MGPPALQGELQQRRRSWRLEALQHRVAGAGRLARWRTPPSGRRPGRAADRGIDHAPVVATLALDQRQVAPLHGPLGQLDDQRAVGPGRCGPPPAVPRFPCPAGARSRVAPARTRPRPPARPGRGTAPAARHQRPSAVARTRVHDQPGRLVHHDHLVVRVDHLERHPGFGADARRTGCGQRDVSDGARHERGAPDCHRDAVDQHLSRRDQLRGGGPGHAGQHRHGPVEPDAGQQRRDPTSRASAHCSRLGSPHVSGVTRSRRTRRWSEQEEATTMMTPTVMQASATLNVGQWLRVTKSTTRRCGPRRPARSDSPGRRPAPARRRRPANRCGPRPQTTRQHDDPQAESTYRGWPGRKRLNAKPSCRPGPRPNGPTGGRGRGGGPRPATSSPGRRPRRRRPARWPRRSPSAPRPGSAARQPPALARHAEPGIGQGPQPGLGDGLEQRSQSP